MQTNETQRTDPKARVRFHGAIMTLSHAYGKPVLEWIGVAIVTIIMVAITAWLLMDPPGYKPPTTIEETP